MKKIVLFLLLFTLHSFVIHKFYVSIYQLEHNIKQKRLEITSRIFIDDITDVLEKNNTKKILLESKNHHEENNVYLKKYFLDKLFIKINNAQKPILYKSYEIEDNIVICYFVINDVSKIKSISIQNTALTEIFEDQQNIIQAQFNNDKKSLVLTAEKTKGLLK